MEFEKWKKEMESEERRKNQKLEKEIEILKDKNAKLQNEAKCLTNRCYVLSKGSTCAFCELKETKCEHMPSPEEKAKMVDKIMHETLEQLVERLENEEDEE